MKLQVYLSEQEEGWKKVNIPHNLRTHRQVMTWVSDMYNSGKCRGFLVSENPKPYPVFS